MCEYYIRREEIPQEYVDRLRALLAEMPKRAPNHDHAEGGYIPSPQERS